MKRRCALPLLLAALAVLPLAGALAQSQGAMNVTASRAFERADAQLNVVYRRVQATLLDAMAREKLQKSERAWIAYRDAEADLAADEYRGGTAEPMAYSDAMTGLTNARIKALQDLQAEMTKLSAMGR